MSGALTSSPEPYVFATQLKNCISWYSSKDSSSCTQILQQLSPAQKAKSIEFLDACEVLLGPQQPIDIDDDSKSRNNNDIVVGSSPEVIFRDMYIKALDKWSKGVDLQFVKSWSVDDKRILMQILNAAALLPLSSPIDGPYIPPVSFALPPSMHMQGLGLSTSSMPSLSSNFSAFKPVHSPAESAANTPTFLLQFERKSRTRADSSAMSVLSELPPVTRLDVEDPYEEESAPRSASRSRSSQEDNTPLTSKSHSPQSKGLFSTSKPVHSKNAEKKAAKRKLKLDDR